MGTSSGAVLAGRNITVRYGRGNAGFLAVSDVSVSLQAGEAVGLVGESGSGKSTLGRALAGIEPLTAGTVEWLGRTPTLGRWPSRKITGSDRWKVQMVFQDPYGSLDPYQRVIDAVAEAHSHWQHVSKKDARSTALDALADLGISADQASRLPRQLSGGQRQRVSLARALAPCPRILIADEPTSSIDQSAQLGVLKLLSRVREEHGLGLLLISHDLRVIEHYTSRVYVMKNGVVIESGATQALFANPRHEYTRTLIAAIPGRQPNTS